MPLPKRGLGQRHEHTSLSASYRVHFKKKTLYAEEQNRPDIKYKREQWKKYQARIDPSRLVFIDETWIKTNMVRLYGRSMKGQRLIGHAPFGHWKTLTFVGALRADGMMAPMVFDRPMNGDIFAAWVRQCLLPTLKTGDIVVMDNLASHKSPKIRQMLRSVGAHLFYLPPYSPDLNPIECCFSKIKAWMRKMKKRTVESIHDALANVINAITHEECRNYLFNAGYAI